MPPSNRYETIRARIGGMHRLAAVLTLLMLGGCVEYRESLVLERDQSGTVVMAIGVKEALLRAADIAEPGMYDPASALHTLQAQQGLQIIDRRTETREGTRWLHLTLTFDSLAALNGIDRIEQYRGLFGNMTLSENPNSQWVLTRTIHPRLHDRPAESLLPSLIGPMLTGYPWRYEVRFPAKVLDTNGETAPTAGNVQIVRWQFTLADLVAEPRVMRATFSRTGIGPVGIAVGAALMLVGIVAAQIMQRRRKRPSAIRS